MAAETEFILNYKNKYEIDITPQGDSETFKPLAAGIKNISTSGNEIIDQTSYYDGEGMGYTEVTGGQLVFTVTGDRLKGDEAQDYVMGLQRAYGQARKTKLKVTPADGSDPYLCDITIANIEDAAGDANAKDEISFEMHVNGAPTLVNAG